MDTGLTQSEAIDRVTSEGGATIRLEPGTPRGEGDCDTPRCPRIGIPTSDGHQRCPECHLEWVRAQATVAAPPRPLAGTVCVVCAEAGGDTPALRYADDGRALCGDDWLAEHQLLTEGGRP